MLCVMISPVDKALNACTKLSMARYIDVRLLELCSLYSDCLDALLRIT